MIAAWFILAAGACLLVLGLALFVSTLAFLRKAVRTTGVVLRHVMETFNTEDGPRTYFHPVVEFDDGNGEKRQVKMSVGTGAITHTRGCLVTLLYRPDRPNDARFDSFLHLWFFPLALSVAGCLALAVGAGIWNFAHTGDHRFIFAVAFTGGGGLFASIGVIMFVGSLRSLARTTLVQGVVVDSSAADPNDAACPTAGRSVEFEDADGEKHRLATLDCRHALGAHVPVRYDRNDPGIAHVPRAVDTWLFSIICTGLGLPLFVVGLMIWMAE